MKNIVIIPNINKDKELSVTKSVVEKLISCGADVYIESKYRLDEKNIRKYDIFPSCAELVIVVGGDGSFIDASSKAIENNIPIFGVNLGKFGYLSEVEPDNLDILERLFSGDFKVKEKMLLTVSHISGDEETKSDRLAVNDIIITRESYMGIADFSLETKNGEKVKYRADGMIFSTPAGSTAYSLSAGGPVMAHGVDSLLATPICPHSFFNRSIIFNPTEIIKLKNTGDADLSISVDGRHFKNARPGESCTVSMASEKIKTLTFNENNMFSTLFRKMRIMEDIK